MWLECIATIVACTIVSQSDQSDVARPNVEMRVLNARPVVGEPLVVNFVLSNETQEEICTPPPSYIEGAPVHFTLHAYSAGEYVGRLSSGGGGCLKQFGVIRFDGHCSDSLEPGQQLHGHGLGVLLPAKNKDLYGPTDSVPLDPGKYTLRGEVLWGSWRLKTDDVRIEVLAPRTRDDLRASQLVDHTYASFMSSYPTMGIGKALIPVMSVKAILEECPNSIHAQLARSRLLVLQSHKLSRDYGTTDEEREAAKQQAIDIVSRISDHLAQQDDDPLEVDLMDGKVQLLRRLERENELRQAIDALIEKYPDSGRTRRAQKMWKQIHSNPNDPE